jgi:hypothetical protein
MYSPMTDNEIYVRELVRVTVENRMKHWQHVIESAWLKKAFAFSEGEASDVVAMLEAECAKMDAKIASECDVC